MENRYYVKNIVLILFLGLIANINAVRPTPTKISTPAAGKLQAEFTNPKTSLARKNEILTKLRTSGFTGLAAKLAAASTRTPATTTSSTTPIATTAATENAIKAVVTALNNKIEEDKATLLEDKRALEQEKERQQKEQKAEAKRQQEEQQRIARLKEAEAKRDAQIAENKRKAEEMARLAAEKAKLEQEEQAAKEKAELLKQEQITLEQEKERLRRLEEIKNLAQLAEEQRLREEERQKQEDLKNQEEAEDLAILIKQEAEAKRQQEEEAKQANLAKQAEEQRQREENLKRRAEEEERAREETRKQLEMEARQREANLKQAEEQRKKEEAEELRRQEEEEARRLEEQKQVAIAQKKYTELSIADIRKGLLAAHTNQRKLLDTLISQGNIPRQLEVLRTGVRDLGTVNQRLEALKTDPKAITYQSTDVTDPITQLQNDVNIEIQKLNKEIEELQGQQQVETGQSQKTDRLTIGQYQNVTVQKDARGKVVNIKYTDDGGYIHEIKPLVPENVKANDDYVAAAIQINDETKNQDRAGQIGVLKQMYEENYDKFVNDRGTAQENAKAGAFANSARIKLEEFNIKPAKILGNYYE